jgi:hypothetical protein
MGRVREPGEITGDVADTTGSEDLTVLRTGGSAAQESMAPRVLKNRFVLERKIGAGGMGTVYAARDLRKVEARDRNPYVAVKVLNNDFRAHPDAFIALQREASKSQALAHPNIVSIYDFDKDGDIPFMTMELLEGKELAELLRDYPNGLPDAMAWAILTDVCAALKRAHDGGVAHADFKPGNVFVLTSGRAKILDFGIARAARVNQANADQTVFDPGRFAALTPAYASAAMLRGAEPEPSDDIYSLGVVAYQLFAGVHPYLRVRADEAAEQGARPKRLRQLGRRQWRTLERMLAFEREDRPPSMDAVIAGLLPVSPYRYWGVAAVALALVLVATAAWMGAFKSPAPEIAAREALIGAQVHRIGELLGDATFTSDWHRRVADEVDRLAAMAGTAVETARVRARVLEAYERQMRASIAFDDAIALLQAADRFASGGRFEAGHQWLAGQQLGLLDALLAETVPSPDWMQEIEVVLARLQQHFDGLVPFAEIEQAVGETYLAHVSQRLGEGEAAFAARLVDAATPRVFDLDMIERASALVASWERTEQQREARAARRTERAMLDREFETLARTSCQRIDAVAVKATHDRLNARFPWARTAIATSATQTLANCISELAEIDHDRALSLQQTALREFGPVPALEAFQSDPCAMRYLIGRGQQPGRSGFCADQLASGGTGPRLVVIPRETGRYAIARFETSWQDVLPFCAATQRCIVADDLALPVTGFTVVDAEAFAAWLTAESGFRYRLPTLAEWRLAAGAGTADPNRNCQVQLAGVTRGVGPIPAADGEMNGFGLVNVLGNVQEWVRDGDRWRAAGGAFNDPIGRCEAGFARDHTGGADPATGFRLVREIR